MRFSLNRLKNWLTRSGAKLTALAAVLWVVVFTLITAWKFRIYAYNAIDLAYFNQVFWNMLNGHFFQQTLHPHLSLGDHAGFAMPFLLPLYALKPGPQTLLFFQNIALAAPVYPLFLIAKRRFGNFHSAFLRAVLPVGIAFAWLLNPIVQNIALFEFHLLPFALFPLFMAILAYDRDKKLAFLVYAGIALLVREDVALVVAAIALIGWIERKDLWWRTVPLALGAVWFTFAMGVVSHFNPDGSYKFLVYYSWLGDSFGTMALGILQHPIVFLSHIITVANLEMAIGFLMPLLFLPLLRPSRLILAAGPLVQILLTVVGGGALILQTHYGTLFLPAIFFAGIEGIRAIPALMKRVHKTRATESVRHSLVLLAVAVLYATFALGPLVPVASRLLDPTIDKERVTILDELVAQVPRSTGVAASQALLPHLSSREHLYALHYHFLGTTQFGAQDYALPENTRYIAFDTDDLLLNQTGFPMTGWAAPSYREGYGRLRTILGPEVFAVGPARLYEYRRPYDKGGEEIMVFTPTKNALLSFNSRHARIERRIGSGQPMLVIDGIWSAGSDSTDDLTERLILTGSDGTTVERLFPFAGGIASTTELGGKAVHETMRILLPQLPEGTYTPTIELVRREGFLSVDGIRSTGMILENEKTVFTVPFPSLELVH